jgi:predicted DNA-binding transcriptional regulator YafY
MRADRLLALMMLLQREGQLTAEELSRELAVSPRTIYRDVDALSGAGVPIYANGGPGGGYALLDSYRTTLTGLNEAEVKALFMLTVPGPLADLGLNRELQASILKLTSALPTPQQAQAQFARQRLHVDPRRWFSQAGTTPWLGLLQEAVWQNRRVQMRTRRSAGGWRERVIEPYSLVSKANHWYLVGQTEAGLRVFRVSRLEEVSLLAETFDRPVSFDLLTFWDEWVADFENNRPRFPVTLRLHERVLPALEALLGPGEPLAGANEPGWQQRQFQFEGEGEAQYILPGFGADVEVLEPVSLRLALGQVGAALAARYASV